IRDMLRDEKVIGLLAIDSQEAGLGILTGDRWEVIDTLTSGVAGKHRQGGQSARRFERLRENELNEYFHRIAEHAQKIFIDGHKISGLIVGGPGPTKENFLKEEYLDYRLQNNVLATIDISYSGSEGIRELLEKVNEQGIISEYRLLEEKKLVKKFMSQVYSDEGLSVYGIHDVLNMLKSGIVDTLIITDEIPYMHLEIKCNKCGDIDEKYVDRINLINVKQEEVSKSCPKCGSQDREITEKDIVDFLEELSANIGSKMEVISSKTEEGAQLGSLGNIGALLRFKPSH
ncbi:MAG: peptide chain release factor aRF-1, partial [Nitrososphaeraceae archaeon]